MSFHAIRVANLPSSANRGAVECLFSSLGEIANISISSKPSSDESVADVESKKPIVIQKAYPLHDCQFSDKQLDVSLCKLSSFNSKLLPGNVNPKDSLESVIIYGEGAPTELSSLSEKNPTKFSSSSSSSSSSRTPEPISTSSITSSPLHALSPPSSSPSPESGLDCGSPSLHQLSTTQSIPPLTVTEDSVIIGSSHLKKPTVALPEELQMISPTHNSGRSYSPDSSLYPCLTRHADHDESLVIAASSPLVSSASYSSSLSSSLSNSLPSSFPPSSSPPSIMHGSESKGGSTDSENGYHWGSFCSHSSYYVTDVQGNKRVADLDYDLRRKRQKA